MVAAAELITRVHLHSVLVTRLEHIIYQGHKAPVMVVMVFLEGEVIQIQTQTLVEEEAAVQTETRLKVLLVQVIIVLGLEKPDDTEPAEVVEEVRI
jgi:hypothetical protein